MELQSQISRIALSFGIGLLLGLERGWSTRDARPGTRAAGVRTFAISGLLGGLVGAMAHDADGALTLQGGILLAAALLAFAGIMIVFSREQSRAAANYSATTTIAALLTYVLGAYAALGDVRIAAASAIAAATVLIFRQGLHEWVARITRAEFESALLLLAMTFIGLPLVPNGLVGPLGGVNLREIWLIAIVLAIVSFAGYIGVKLLGERRGVLVAAAAGGVVSSTAVALANARRAAARESTPRILAAGTALATAVSLVRVLAITGALIPSLTLLVAPALLVSATFAAAFALISAYARGARPATESATQFRNPFGFWSVLSMAVSMGVLILAGRFFNERFGSVGAMVGAAVMGLFDVDAMTVSVARLHALDPRVGAYALAAGVAANTMSKVAISAILGRGWFAVRIAVLAAGCILSGWLAIILTLRELAP